MPRGQRNPAGAATQFERTIDTAEKDAAIARWKAANPDSSFQECADHFGISKTSAYDSYRRALDTAIRPAGQDALAAELLKLDAQEAAAWQVLRANHVTVSDGRVVVDEGVPVTDWRSILMAIDRLLKIADRRSRFLGLDAPSRSEVTVISRDAVEQAIAELEAQLAANDEPAAAG